MNVLAFEKKKTTFMTDTGFVRSKTGITEWETKANNAQQAQSIEEDEEINFNENKDLRQKKWESLYEKILFIPEDSNYYQKFPITPGINFIKKLFSHDKSEKLVNTLKINIPETYWNDTEIYYVYNDPKNFNLLTMIKNHRDFNLFENLKTIEKEFYKREFDETSMIEPFLIVRTKNSEYENNVKVERFEKAREIKGKEIGEGGIVQRYIRCKGRNRDLDNNSSKKPKLVPVQQHKRVTFKNEIVEKNYNAEMDQESDKAISPNNDSLISGYSEQYGMMPNVSNFNNQLPLASIAENKKVSKIPALNIGGGISNNKNYIKTNNSEGHVKKIFTKPTIIRLEYKTRHNNSKKPNIAYCCINKEYVEPVIKKKGFTEKYTSQCVLQTTLKDTFQIYVMAGESLKPYEYYANEIVVYVQKLYKFVLNTIVIDFIKDERGIIYFLGVKAFTPYKDPENLPPEFNIKDYLKNENNIKKIYKTLTCRLCNLAYPKSKINKVVTLKLLLDLKENLAKRGEDILMHISRNKSNESQSCKVCDLCYKLIITEQELMEIQKTIAVCNNIPVQSEEDFKKELPFSDDMANIPIKLHKANQWRVMFYFVRFYALELNKITFNNKMNYKLYIKLFNQKYGIPIFNDINKFKSHEEVEINLSKIFYFFTSENSNLKQILKNEEVDFRIVINDDWHSPLAQCKTTCLSFYESETVSKTVRNKNTLNFFSNQMKYFKCQVYVGLNNDGEILSDNLTFYDFKSCGSIFLTNHNYFSYHPLPDDWYELFMPNAMPTEDFQDYNLEATIEKIIYDLEFPDKKHKLEKADRKLKTIKEEVLYDPYDILVQVNGKKTLISKMDSIPVIHDKRYIDKEKILGRSRPQTSILMNKFNMPAIMETRKETKSTYVAAHTPSKSSGNSSSFISDIKQDKIIIQGGEKLTDEMLNSVLGKIDKHIDENFNN